ncbi:zinc-binding dehydrogenase [Paraconexibacter antarcticus]|uniref:Zinc-binding dehydrogenase n=1 Tax=Paraconexibacter antarcticus TaxID=2949664 RepID=A0ABY5DNK1_9ACTN|nr:zinc-binding dehydrogenase [Paraconexibacter antarcticus]UTI63608.1 zinc-binding dehydrogenase [Paraconexibacter antarcticus]
MRAVVLERFGGPEVLATREVPDPEPREGWVTVDVKACALNWHDCLVRQGRYPGVPLPHVIGSDGAGVRSDTGERVVILPSLFWGDDERAPGPEWEILGDRTPGTYAERVSVPAANVLPLPAGWSFTDAAALPLAGLTAFRALFVRGELRAGETVLVLGAGGGVASMAIALAHAAGARVLVTTSSEDKLELAQALGAEDGALYTSDAWPERIRALSGGRGADLVIDSAGAWEQALAATAAGGRLVTFGATQTATTEVDVRRFYFAQQTILGTTMGSPRDFAGLLGLVARLPAWRPLVDRILPLEEVAEAHALMESRGHSGKVVLHIAS